MEELLGEQVATASQIIISGRGPPSSCTDTQDCAVDQASPSSTVTSAVITSYVTNFNSPKVTITVIGTSTAPVDSIGLASGTYTTSYLVTTLALTGTTTTAIPADATAIFPSQATNTPYNNDFIPTTSIEAMAIGITMGALLFALGIFACYRIIKLAKRNVDDEELEGISELQTIANTYEIEGKPKKPAEAVEIGEPPSPLTAELPSFPVLPGTRGLGETESSPFLEGGSDAPEGGLPVSEGAGTERDTIVEVTQSQRNITTPHNDSVETAPVNLLTSSSSSAPAPAPQISKLDQLRDKIDKVRAEKERITKLQELNDLEMALQREILEGQRKEMANEVGKDGGGKKLDSGG